MSARKRTANGGLLLLIASLVWLAPREAEAQAMLMLLFGDKIVTKNTQPGKCQASLENFATRFLMCHLGFPFSP